MKNIPISPQVEKIKRNRRSRRLRLIVLFSILFVSLIAFLSYFSSDKHFKIDKINISGDRVLSKDDLEEEIYNSISGKYIYLFSKSNSLIYPSQKVEENLLKKFPRIETILITREGFKTLKIDIKERAESYLYCGEKIPESKEEVGENCYYINDDGFIFDKAPYFSGNIYFKYYLSIGDGVSDPLGKQMMDKTKLKSLRDFINGIAMLDFQPVYIVVGDNGINFLYLSHKDGDSNPKIIFKNDNDLKEILNNFALSMKKKEFSGEIKSKYDKLLYIDLRFKDKVLYKFE